MLFQLNKNILHLGHFRKNELLKEKGRHTIKSYYELYKMNILYNSGRAQIRKKGCFWVLWLFSSADCLIGSICCFNI